MGIIQNIYNYKTHKRDQSCLKNLKLLIDCKALNSSRSLGSNPIDLMAAAVVKEEAVVVTRNLFDFAKKHCGIEMGELGELSFDLKKRGVAISFDADRAETISGTNGYLWEIKLMIDEYISRVRKTRALISDLAEKVAANFLLFAQDEKSNTWVSEKEFASFIPHGYIWADLYYYYDGKPTCSTWDNDTIIAVDIEGKRCYLQWHEICGGDHGDSTLFTASFASRRSETIVKISQRLKATVSICRFFASFAELEHYYSKEGFALRKEPFAKFAQENPRVISQARTRPSLKELVAPI
ncbi:MAG: hypothetical protein Harvfovirus27_12 [Harvfovirus sp.]|uniref:Uncharacterized protein n=1 Tax=Harvfovirus sp. TaxID=2487768 RepID=A0A3G5A674_9VIRU|nr:MAG: hypothetical protein Harvfovirus27_12 [Harvfovirus sp.]